MTDLLLAGRYGRMYVYTLMLNSMSHTSASRVLGSYSSRYDRYSWEQEDLTSACCADIRLSCLPNVSNQSPHIPSRVTTLAPHHPLTMLTCHLKNVVFLGQGDIQLIKSLTARYPTSSQCTYGDAGYIHPTGSGIVYPKLPQLGEAAPSGERSPLRARP